MTTLAAHVLAAHVETLTAKQRAWLAEKTDARRVTDVPPAGANPPREIAFVREKDSSLSVICTCGTRQRISSKDKKRMARIAANFERAHRTCAKASA